jgi:hypothetical protein
MYKYIYIYVYLYIYALYMTQTQAVRTPLLSLLTRHLGVTRDP